MNSREVQDRPQSQVTNGRGGPGDDEPHDGGGRRAERPGWVRTLFIVVGAVVVILVLIWGARWLSYALAHQTTDDAKVDADTVVVTSKIQERVDRILTDTNQTVHRGQLLIALDDRDEATKVAQAQAALNAQVATQQAAQQNVDLTRAQQSAQNSQNSGGIAAAQAQIASADSSYADAVQQLAAAQAQVSGAHEALLKANADLGRTQALVASGDEPRANLDAAKAAAADAQSQYQATVDRVNAARAAAQAAKAIISANQGQLQTAQGKLAESQTPYKVSTQVAQAESAGAQVASARAQLRAAQDQLSYTKIYSPIDGFVAEKDVEVGQTVSPGTTLLNLVPSNKIYITANYKETQVGEMKPGQKVDISVDAYKGTAFHGHVEAVGPASQNQFALVPAQNATGNFVKVTQRIPVRIIVDDPPADKPLRPGMSVETSVAIK